MAHFFSNNSSNPFSWAGQAADGPFGQKWLPNADGHDDPAAQSAGPARLLSTDAPRNDASLIKDFNDELPDQEAQDGFLGHSSWLLVNGAAADHTDLPFDLAIGNDIDLDVAKPASYDLARTSSQASSTGVDEDDLHDFAFSTDYGEGNSNDFNSPGTSFSDVLLSTNPSLENSPVSSRCPFLSMHTGSPGPAIPSKSRSTTNVSHPFVANVNGNSNLFPGNDPAGMPGSFPRQNVSALSMGLADQGSHPASSSASSEYFEHWSSQAGDESIHALGLNLWNGPALPEGFFPSMESHLGPSFVIVPPETPDVTMGGLDDATVPETQASSQTHPIDYYLSATYAAAQPTEPRSVPVMPIPQALTAVGANRLSVPVRRRRRTSDPVRMNAQHRVQASTSRLHPITSGSGLVSPRGSPSSNHRARFASPVDNLRFQRLRPTEPSRDSGVTLPMPIASRPRRPGNPTAFPDGESMMVRPGRPGTMRGRRSGPMDPVSRGQAKETRNKKMVCIRCKHSKQKCNRSDESLDGSCVGCERHGGSPRWPGPCVKAHFEDLILSGSCNYVSSHAIYHPTLDGTTRIRRVLPKHINVNEVITRLDRVRRHFNIKVYQEGKPLYVLDLDTCHEYLQGLRQQMDSTVFKFSTFIDREILRTDTRNDDWERCMTQTTTGDLLTLLCTINNMPSRASFSYVAKPCYAAPGAAAEWPINVEDPGEADNLMLAAQLSRIICRKLEVKAYQHLQRLLHEWGTMDDDKVLPFLQSLGRILLTLRWRLSWWVEVPEDVGTSDDDDEEESDEDEDEDASRRRAASRAHTLCRVLYFYYCCVRRRLHAWTNVDMLRGVRSRYPDTEAEVRDDFPGDESLDGFEAWMLRGRLLIAEAGAVSRLRSMGLLA
ncbi:hypothetical protein CTA2_5279 [Colletotrichum tanaceti]|uniref:Uncharacterized protein n=1 Tax=Colletotrichum tanaceti TaxID=1306861 RepID=A0A4U6XAP8_9PEZI|nr:hypothetical protein CTA2_5279 [Colletotrichum tanaceti]TKW50767.1 hypothetical protein CTA1_5964 [Colletotrichum tanaceti]